MNELEAARSRVLHDPLVRRVTGQLPSSPAGPLFLVGGALRDAWLRRPLGDLDFVVSGDARSYARRLAEQLSARLVLLDEQWGVARLVWNVPESTAEPMNLDFASLQGSGIDEDLLRRDFTCNAMAINLGREPQRGPAGPWEDPAGGIADLTANRIRMVRDSCFRADPVRLLRAFRLACRLDLSLERGTLEQIEKDKGVLLASAAERIGEEFFKFLGGIGSLRHLQEMDRCGLLSTLFPELDGLRGLKQGRHHHLDAWSHTLETYRLLESGLQSGFPGLQPRQAEVRAWIGTEERTPALLKIAALLHDIGKPATLSVDPEGEIHFYGHAKLGSEIAARLVERIRWSRADQERVRNWVRYHLGPLNLLLMGRRGPPAERAMIRFLRKAGPDAVGVLVLALCDEDASTGPASSPARSSLFREMVDALFALVTRLEARGPQTKTLVSGHDLISTFGLKPGPLVGRILKRVEEENILGRVRTREEALALVKSLLDAERTSDR